MTPDQSGAGIAGKDFDPYAGQETDDFLLNPFVLICHILAALGFKTALNYCGYFPFHTYYQVHVFQNALAEGWNNGAIKSGVIPTIPACPILWQIVIHYWKFGGFLGIIAYELVAYIRVVIVISGIILAAHWNVITPQKAIAIILQQFGVTLP